MQLENGGVLFFIIQSLGSCSQLLRNAWYIHN